MKKILVIMLFLFSMTVFAEKLTTDGKYNMDKLQGNWQNGALKIVRKNNEWYAGFLDFNYENPKSDYLWYRIKSYRNGILVIQNYYTSQHKVKDRNYYFAWDTKYKTMVEVDRELNIIEKIKRKIDRPVN